MKFLSPSDRKNLRIMVSFYMVFFLIINIRLCFLMIYKNEYYTEKAEELHERERSIKAKRGEILDRNGTKIASNVPVCSISVIHNQIKDSEEVIRQLSEILELDIEKVRNKVEKLSSREKIKENVDLETAEKIRKLKLSGVIVDEDYKRNYPYSSTASKVIGFTGQDNQGVVGLEVYYNYYLMGKSGSINAVTDARGIELSNEPEIRNEPEDGNSLVTTIDLNIQIFAENLAEKVRKEKSAKRVAILVMNPQNGEIYALAEKPDYNLNEPFTIGADFLPEGTESAVNLTDEENTSILNGMWRCFAVNDTYEPGSTFKIFTATAAFESDVLSVNDTFYCPGYKIVADRKIRCSRVTGHGSEDFRQGIMNSCNPVFMEVGERTGKEQFYYYFDKLGLNDKTGIDLYGEASSITHKIENVGPVELATMSFGQTFQITPLELVRCVSAVVNGGTLVTPHFGKYIVDKDYNIINTLSYSTTENVISEKTSETMRTLLTAVVSEGTGSNAKIEGYNIGGKTATSEKLPRSDKKYIASFIGFAPSENPKVLALVLIDEPQGLYYGGTIAAPVVKELFLNILPYLGILKETNYEH